MEFYINMIIKKLVFIIIALFFNRTINAIIITTQALERIRSIYFFAINNHITQEEFKQFSLIGQKGDSLKKRVQNGIDAFEMQCSDQELSDFSQRQGSMQKVIRHSMGQCNLCEQILDSESKKECYIAAEYQKAILQIKMMHSPESIKHIFDNN